MIFISAIILLSHSQCTLQLFAYRTRVGALTIPRVHVKINPAEKTRHRHIKFGTIHQKLLIQ